MVTEAVDIVTESSEEMSSVLQSGENERNTDAVECGVGMGWRAKKKAHLFGGLLLV
jgi:hypothetical protein